MKNKNKNILILTKNDITRNNKLWQQEYYYQENKYLAT